MFSFATRNNLTRQFPTESLFIAWKTLVNIYFEADDLNNLTKTINKELSKVKSWLDCNKLVHNIDKTNLSFFIHTGKNYLTQLTLNLARKTFQGVNMSSFWEFCWMNT